MRLAKPAGRDRTKPPFWQSATYEARVANACIGGRMQNAGRNAEPRNQGQPSPIAELYRRRLCVNGYNLVRASKKRGLYHRAPHTPQPKLRGNRPVYSVPSIPVLVT